ncbi:MAG: hemerythrin domain-containing protein [Deltaproteobacteria bacterium]|nr:hemerythrin domain-containing protein [Deltaproteobacteria bacterium]
MDLFDLLTDDHRVISRTLDALDGFLSRVERGAELDLVELNRFVVFLREFVELAHQEREEHILFPAMARLGYAKHGAPIAHIHQEHLREHQILFEIRQLAVRGGPMSSTNRAKLIGLLREVAAFDREHLRKENELLYPAVQKELSGKSLEDVSQDLWRGEEAPRRLVEDAWLRTLSDELVRAHAPAPTAG